MEKKSKAFFRQLSEKSPSYKFIMGVVKGTRSAASSVLRFLGIIDKKDKALQFPLPPGGAEKKTIPTEQVREKVSEVLKNNYYALPEQTKQNDMRKMETRFKALMDGYRQKMVSLSKIKLKRPKLSPSNELNRLAAEMAQKEADLAPTRKGEKLDHNVHMVNALGYTEILTSGFKSPEEALEKFITSDKHYPALVGDFKEVGYAIREGSDGKYYLAVLFREGKPALHQPEKISIPDDKRNEQVAPLDKNNLISSLRKNNRGVMATYFEALDQEFRDKTSGGVSVPEKDKKRSGVYCELYTEGMAKLSQKQKKSEGSFVIVMKKGSKRVVYLVTDTPPRLERTEIHEGKERNVGVNFPGLLKDFESAKSSELIKEPLQKEDSGAKKTSESKAPADDSSSEEADTDDDLVMSDKDIIEYNEGKDSRDQRREKAGAGRD